MNLELIYKVALVSVASSGIGRAIARLLNDEACRLALVGRQKHLLHEAAEELAKTTDKTPPDFGRGHYHTRCGRTNQGRRFGVVRPFGFDQQCGLFSTDRR